MEEEPGDPTVVVYRDEEDARPTKRQRSASPSRPVLNIKPLGTAPPPREFWGPRPSHKSVHTEAPDNHVIKNVRPKEAIAAIVAAAAAAKEQAALQAAEEAAKAEKAKQEKEARRLLAKKKASSAKESREGKQLLKEKRLLKLVGAVVVKCMSKYQKRMDHDTFKKYAKEVSDRLLSAWHLYPETLWRCSAYANHCREGEEIL